MNLLKEEPVGRGMRAADVAGISERIERQVQYYLFKALFENRNRKNTEPY